MPTVPAIRAARFPESPPASPARLLRRFVFCVARWRQRRDLADLDEHLLRDIGVTREQATREASRPFWD